MSDSAIPATPIESELRSLSRALLVPEPRDTIVDTVLALLEQERAPSPQSRWRRLIDDIASVGAWLRIRWRLATAVVVGAALALVVASPAGAGVREWLGFGSVVIQEQGQPAAGSVAVTSSANGGGSQQPDGREMPLDQARAAVPFTLGVPAVLGDPDRVTVSDGSRVVSMQWLKRRQGSAGNDAPIQLDQIAGSLAPYYFKKYYEDVDFTTVNSTEAIWLAKPHPIVVLEPDGSERVQTARQSGPSLIWQQPGVTSRLEGVGDLQQARTIAESMQD